VSDPWEDEGFGADDDWAGEEGLVGDLEDDPLSGVEDDEPDDSGDDTPSDEED
jgi:hypothetical protein